MRTVVRTTVRTVVARTTIVTAGLAVVVGLGVASPTEPLEADIVAVDTASAGTSAAGAELLDDDTPWS